MKYEKIEWKIPKGFNLADELNLIGQALITDIKKGVRDGVDIHGAGFKRLNRKYKKQKIAAGYPATILVRTGRMVGRGGIGGAMTGIGGTGVYLKRATKSKQVAIVTVAKNRQDLTVWHNEGAGELPVREWFGIAHRTDAPIRKAVLASINRKFRA